MPNGKSGTGWVIYCSRTCRWESVRAETRRRKEVDSLVAGEVAALRRIARYVERPRLTRKPCTSCGAPTIGVLQWRRTCEPCKELKVRESRRKQRQTPSGRARRKREKVLRRTRVAVAAEAIDPIAVFERDKWTCRLCGKRTPKSLRGKQIADAPELDHIIPLALGGGHTWSNVQCACRACNGEKGATIKGQLGLPLAA